MCHCKACDAPITPGIELKDASEEAGYPVYEDMCGRCIAAAHVNMPQEYYDGLYLDKHGHPSHVVLADPLDYLL